MSARPILLSGLASAAIIASAVTSPAYAQQQTYSFDIPAQDLGSALRAFAQKTRVQVIFDGDAMRGKRSRALKGQHSVDAGIAILLQGSGLAVRRNAEGVLVVSRTTGAAPSSAAGEPRTASSLGEGETTISAVDEPSDEIIVTAQKRVERLADTPIPVSAISAEALVEANQLSLRDYYNKIPGLSLALAGDGSAPTVAIRGITTGGNTAPTVGIVVDEVPYGSSTSIGVAALAPDIDPGDLARVEVLRGPQGPLYGANSMGGLIKYVTIDPSTERVSGRIQAGLSGIRYGDDVGYSIRGSINVPLTDDLAVRASAFTVREPGYIDNIKSGEEDIDGRKSVGGRLSALWKPSSIFSLKLGALLQDSHREGGTDADTAITSNLAQSSLTGTGSYRKKTAVYSALANIDLGGVDIVSATAYTIDRLTTNVDYAANALNINQSNAVFGVRGARGAIGRQTKKFSQELRADIAVNDSLQWLIGGFYTKEDIDVSLRVIAVDPVTERDVGLGFLIEIPTPYEEVAAFSNLRIELLDNLEVQFGGRLSRIEQSSTNLRSGPFAQLRFGSDPSNIPKVTTTESPFTYLITPRWQVTDDIMLYARVASGYRPGGVNANCGLPGVPCAYDSDSTTNYELGVKADLLDGNLFLDASVYRIDWKDIQVTVVTGGLAYSTNASRARSEGIELSATARPWKGMKLSGWTAFNNAELVEPFPATSTVVGRVGDRLPLSARWTASASADQQFQIDDRMFASVGGTVSYVGSRLGLFRTATQVRGVFPSYTQFDLRASLDVDQWRVSAYVNNITDTRGILRTGLDSVRPTWVTFIQPRNFGLQVSRAF